MVVPAASKSMHMTEIDTTKASARKAAFAARKQAHGTGLDSAANLKLIGHILAQPAKIIAGYMAIRTEIDPLQTMACLIAEGREICVPVIKGEGQPLEFHRWTPDCEMVAGPFGARVPANPEPLIPDLVIAPLVAFDKTLTRLGYGGGFYDRSLIEIRAQKPCPAIGFAYSAQELPSVPRAPYDVPLDLIITETTQ